MIFRTEGLFTFQGLLNLCQQGHMKCLQPDDLSTVAWPGPEESERIVFVITDPILEDLKELGQKYPANQGRIDWFLTSPGSYLHQCQQWGVLEVITKLHSNLMNITEIQETRALDMRISPNVLKTIDFACLWQSQIRADDRVVWVAADAAVHAFSKEAVGGEGKGRRIRVLSAHE